MLSAVAALRLCWLFLVCSHLWSPVDMATASRDAFPSNDDPIPVAYPVSAQAWRFHRETSGVARSGLRDEQSTISPDLVSHLQGRERKKQARIIEVLVNVNGIMGMRNRPNVSANPLTPGEKKSLKKRVEGNYELKTRSDKDRNGRYIYSLLLPSCHETASRNSSLRSKSKNFRLFFNVVPPERTIRLESIRIKSAKLMLRTKLPNEEFIAENKYKKLKSDSSNSVLKVKIHAYNRTKGASKKALKLITFSPHNASEWLKIGIVKTVEDWYMTSIRNPGLQVTVFDAKNKPVDPFQVFYDYSCRPSKHHDGRAGDADIERQTIALVDDSTSSFPHLEVVTVASPEKSEKRSQRHLARKNKCHKRPVRVKAKDLERNLKLKNIIEPREFSSAVCEGSCRQCLSASSSSVDARDLTRSQSCCRPIRTKPIKALYMTDDGVVNFGDIPDMVVTRCGCRR